MESSAANITPKNAAKWMQFILGSLLVLGLSPYAGAANKLVDVKYHAIVDHQLELELVFDKPISEPEINLSADPASIQLDFSDSISALEKAQIPINTAGVEQLSSMQDGDNLRLVLALKKK